MTAQKETLTELCPVRDVVARFGNKWSILVLLLLSEHGSVRFNALLGMIPDISAKMLANTLHTLQADGIVDRKAYAVVPPKVEYALTDTGLTLMPIINQLVDWAENNMDAIRKHRRRFDKTNSR